MKNRLPLFAGESIFLNACIRKRQSADKYFDFVCVCVCLLEWLYFLFVSGNHMPRSKDMFSFSSITVFKEILRNGWYHPHQNYIFKIQMVFLSTIAYSSNWGMVWQWKQDSSYFYIIDNTAQILLLVSPM